MSRWSDVCRWVAALATLLWVLLPGRVAAEEAENSLQPAGWDHGIRLPETPDLNSDPEILEIDIEARLAMVEIARGLQVEAWTYNGGIPGPLIRLKVGDWSRGPARRNAGGSSTRQRAATSN